MKPTAFFINTSRGGTYKERDLSRALEEQKIRRRRYRRLPGDNVILTPHNAGSTREAHENVAIYAFGAMARHLRR